MRTYRQHVPGGGPDFHCPLTLSQCLAATRAAAQCKRHTFRHPLCRQHMRQHLGVDVMPSAIHGCGLFAVRPLRKGPGRSFVP